MRGLLAARAAATQICAGAIDSVGKFHARQATAARLFAQRVDVWRGVARGDRRAGSAARADQDDDAERVPSSAADIYSPIERTFTPQAPLPGGPQRLVPGTSLPADDGPVLFQDLKERLRFADPFFRDMKLAVYLRTHDFDRDNASGPRSRAWAGGSALAIKTGFLDDWLQLEAAGATSQPLFAPEGEGGTLLLTQNQAEVSSFAIANARMRFTGHEAVLGRQLVKTPYINPQDNRMLPNAVEGAVITRRRDEAQDARLRRRLSVGLQGARQLALRAVLGGAWRNGGSRRVGGRRQGGADRRTDIGRHRLLDRRRPQHDVRGSRLDHSTPRPCSSASASTTPTSGRWAPTSSPARRTRPNQVSARFAASYADVTLLVAGSHNGDGAELQGPFGSFPAYTVLDQLDFNEAGEKSVVVGAAYDLSKLLIDGLKVQTRYGWAWDAVDAPSGKPLTRQNEFNVELEYLPASGPFENIHVQVFYSMVELPGNPPGETQQPQARGIVTYLVPLL